MRIALLIPVGFALAGAAARIALLHHPAAIDTDLAQPIAVVTYWKSFGGTMFWALFAALAVGTVGYVAALRGLDKARPPGACAEPGRIRVTEQRLSATIMVSALSCAAALTFPVIFSSDVYAYAGYGDLALHGISPYAHARITPSDGLLAAMIWQWGNPPPMCVYGPLFVWIAQLIVAALLPLTVAAPLWGLRVLACASLIACAPLASAAFDPFGSRTKTAAAVGIALNPLAVWNAASGHNDAIALAGVLAGFALAQRARIALGAAAVALSALVKAPALLASAGMVLAAWPDRPRLHRTLTGTVLGTIALVLLSVPLLAGIHAHLAPDGKYAPQFSPQYVLASFLPVRVAAITVASVSLIFAAIGIARLVRGRIDGALCAAMALWIAVPNPYPWYALWLVPVAFLMWGTSLSWFVIASTLTIAIRFYPEATWAVFPKPPGVVLTIAMFAPPAALLIAYMRNLVRPGRPEIRTTVPGFARLRSP